MARSRKIMRRRGGADPLPLSGIKPPGPPVAPVGKITDTTRDKYQFEPTPVGARRRKTRRRKTRGRRA